MRELERVFPALAFAPNEIALVDERGGTCTWRALAALVTERASAIAPSTARLLHAPTSAALVVEIFATQLAGSVPVLVHPRLPAARAQELSARAAQGVASLSGESGEDDHALACVVFTSGSVRTPRAVFLDEGAMRASARAANAHVSFRPGHRWLLSLPLAHVGGLGVLERARLGGGAIVLPPHGVRPEGALAPCAASHVSWVPTQLQDALSARIDIPPSVEVILIGGAPFPASLVERTRGLPVAQTWGMTETCAQVATSAPGAPATCGAPLPGRAVKVSDSGELLVGGRALARAILDERGLRPLPLDDDGFFATGDLGAITDDGHVVVRGRRDAVFISGGENVQPERVEAALLELPTVRRALVVPVPHARFGARPVAFVDPPLAGPLDERALGTALADTLARHELPDAYLAWPDDAREGKPSRADFAARARAALGDG